MYACLKAWGHYVALYVASQNPLLAKLLKQFRMLSDFLFISLQLFWFWSNTFSSRLVSTAEHYFRPFKSTRTSHYLRWYQGSPFKSNETYGNSYLGVFVWHVEFWNKLMNLGWILFFNDLDIIQGRIYNPVKHQWWSF